MLKRAKEAARRVGMLGVTSFRLGEIEHLPIADGVADAVLSNCVLNLCARSVETKVGMAGPSAVQAAGWPRGRPKLGAARGTIWR